jgi:hypothetical protein
VLKSIIKWESVMVRLRVKHLSYNIAQILTVQYQPDLTHSFRINKRHPWFPSNLTPNLLRNKRQVIYKHLFKSHSPPIINSLELYAHSHLYYPSHKFPSPVLFSSRCSRCRLLRRRHQLQVHQERNTETSSRHLPRCALHL